MRNDSSGWHHIYHKILGSFTCDKLISPSSVIKMNYVSFAALFLSSLHLIAARYTLGVKDSFMIAHSFHNNPAFGPAGGMVSDHGSLQNCGSDDLSNNVESMVLRIRATWSSDARN